MSGILTEVYVEFRIVNNERKSGAYSQALSIDVSIIRKEQAVQWSQLTDNDVSLYLCWMHVSGDIESKRQTHAHIGGGDSHGLDGFVQGNTVDAITGEGQLCCRDRLYSYPRN